jgi:protocatechuate 3,4-dioxygenase beta subunit
MPVMKSNHVLAGLAVVVLGGALWLAFTFLGGGGSNAVERGLKPEQVEAQDEAVLDVARSSEDPARAVAEQPEVAPAAFESLALGWDVELGGLIGRVVEEDGTPVADISVALVQVGADWMLAASWAELGEQPPELVLGTTTTDAEGRFRLDGAYDASYQGLGIDLRGPRSTVRVVETQLHHGQVTDVGDIVLRGGCTIVGRVVDEAGEPVAGARVRIFPAPPGEDLSQFLQVGAQDFRSDCSVGISRMILQGGGSPVFDLPPIARKHLDDFPIPTTHTDAEGEYRFEAAPIGEVIQGVDKPDWVGVSRVVATTAGEVRLEDAVLSAGRTIAGVVVDDEGDVLEGVEVMAGSELFGEASILHPAGRTDASGRFSVRGMPDSGRSMACARRNPEEPWAGVLGSAGEQLEIELESVIAVTIHVVDPKGAPVGGAKVTIAPGFEDESPMMMMGLFAGLGAPPPTGRFVETEAGTYVCEQVTPGTYEVTARPAGLALAREKVELWDGKAELTLTCAQGLGLDLTVVDSQTGAGVAGARASILGAGFPFFSALAVGRTGKDGTCRLGPYSSTEGENRGFGFSMEGRQVLVQHPDYADTCVPLEEGVQATQVALVRGGEIHGTIQWGADPPQTLYMLVLENRSEREDIMQAFMPPRLGRTDLSGAFRFTNLPAGTYSLSVFDRFLDVDPIPLMMKDEEPTMVHREDGIELEASARVDVAIDLSPSGRGQTARLAGSVYVDGGAIAGAKIRVSGKGPRVSAESDALGNFETDDFLALGDVHVGVSGDVETPDGVIENVGLYSQSFTPVPQSVRRLDLDLWSRPLRVRVKGPGGEPVAGADVELTDGGSSEHGGAQTDEQGEAVLTLIGETKRSVTVSAEGYAETSVDVDPGQEGFAGELAIELKGAVACAGVCDISALDSPQTSNGAFLRITGSTDGGWERLEPDDLSDDLRASFRVEGLAPGKYQAHLWLGGQQAEEIAFELTELGDENLLLAFQPREEER